MKNVKFDSPAFEDSYICKVPEKLLAVETPPVPQVKAATPWNPDPNIELINSGRYWTIDGDGKSLNEDIRADGPVAGSAGRRVIRVTGDFGWLGNGSVRICLEIMRDMP